MLSHKHRCIFVHIPKAAGTSIESLFLRDLNLDFEDKHSLILGKSTNLYMEPRVLSHLTACQYVSQHYVSQELFDEYFKFSFTRHPVERLFSTYVYLGYSNIISFDIFIKDLLEKLYESKKFNFFLKSQTEFLYDINGNKSLMDYTGSIENIKDDFEFVKKELLLENLELEHVNKANNNNSLRGLKKIIERPFLLTKLNLGVENDKYLTDKSLQVIEKLYNKDFENFDYSL
jgi:hypothetical protein